VAPIEVDACLEACLVGKFRSDLEDELIGRELSSFDFSQPFARGMRLKRRAQYSK
jgi:hypothetical protein